QQRADVERDFAQVIERIYFTKMCSLHVTPLKILGSTGVLVEPSTSFARFEDKVAVTVRLGIANRNILVRTGLRIKAVAAAAIAHLDEIVSQLRPSQLIVLEFTQGNHALGDEAAKG